jgi:hypothetical protein
VTVNIFYAQEGGGWENLDKTWHPQPDRFAARIRRTSVMELVVQPSHLLTVFLTFANPDEHT